MQFGLDHSAIGVRRNFRRIFFPNYLYRQLRYNAVVFIGRVESLAHARVAPTRSSLLNTRLTFPIRDFPLVNSPTFSIVPLVKEALPPLSTLRILAQPLITRFL